jgi:outer membrane protein assembly factor BamB
VLYASDESHIFALEAATGKELWSYATGGSCPLVVNGRVFVGSAPNLYAFSLTERGKVTAEVSGRPNLKTLRPDFGLKVSKPVATASRH